MKSIDPGYFKFGEAYFSFVEKNAIKAWKRHLKMHLNLIVPVGEIQFIFIDEDGYQREQLIGSSYYARITVPPGIWFGFRGVSEPINLLLNIADFVHDPSEVERRDCNAFNVGWSI
jgi:dTDP-4-dehydrorhamnose 3,5-epimerase